MIIKVVQGNRGENGKGIATYCYEADSYVFVNDGKPETQCVAIFKDGKEVQCFKNPFFQRFFICNNTGKTIDTIEFAPIPIEKEE